MKKPSYKKPPFRKKEKINTRAVLCPLHPISIKQVKKGHPWITKDRFSQSFPKNEFLIEGVDKKNQIIGTFIHDPDHPEVLGRLWSRHSNTKKTRESFFNEFNHRIGLAVEQRVTKKIPLDRDNYYLVFAEGDNIPGLKIQILGNIIIVHYYLFAWKKFENEIERGLLKALKKHLPEVKLSQIRYQIRNKTQELKEKVTIISSKNSPKNIITEFGVRYKIFLDQKYDLGIYTDASSIRNKLRPFLKNASQVLNLYSYTGAFSLMALKHSKAHVYSVDLSDEYMKHLEENIALNDKEWLKRHHSLVSNVDDAFDQFTKSHTKFSTIICDPPSSSWDGKKRTNALSTYQRQLKDLLNLLEPNGILVLMLNTAKITRKKFNETIEKEIKNFDEEGAFEIIQQIGLDEDCPTRTSFTEGDYLKVLIIQRQW